MSSREPMQEGALCRSCPHLDYDILLGYHYIHRKIYPIRFCPKKGHIIFKGYKHCSHYPKEERMVMQTPSLTAEETEK